MGNSLAPVATIARREIRDQLRDWRIILPIVALTAFFPWLLNFMATRIVTWMSTYGGELISDRMVPFLMLLVGFFPLTISMVIALESFVGEKERHSIEPLLSSPLKDWQLYLGKLTASLFIPVLAAYLGTTIYIFGIQRSIGWTAPPLLYVQVVLLVLIHAMVMVSGAVVVSAQTTSARAANLLASFIVVPMSLLIQGEALVMFYGNYDVLWYSILAQVILAILLVRMGITHFNREELLGRELDAINPSWIWRTFKNAFTGQAKSVGEWLRREIPSTLRRLAVPALLTLLLLVAANLIGAYFASKIPVPRETMDFESLLKGIEGTTQNVPILAENQVHVLWFHNVRVILLASFLGVFTFGILGLVVVMLPMFIVGFFWNIAAMSGLPAGLVTFALIGPHGLLEIPAIILGGAAIMRLGAVMIAPSHGKTVGEAWLHVLADWARVMLVLVIPLLLGAAVIEIFITPRFALWILGG